jgi:Pectate lyase superfamily protein
MRTWIVLLLLLTHAYASTSILSQGARNVKNASSYGGVSAIGDGVTDDTQAFLDALNIGRGNPLAENGDFLPVSIYVPPGLYKVSQTLIIWSGTFIFGEPSATPTVFLASGSMTSGANPFAVTAAGYGMQPYSTNWSDRGGNFATTNNTFYIECQDINFTVQANNPGCSDVYLFAMAQQGALRNCTLTGTSQQSDALRTDLTGGGGIVQGVTMTGARTAVQINQTSQMAYRACNFNGPVRITNGELINFEACTFNDPNNAGLVWTGGYWFGMTDCAFTGGTPFTPNGAHYHLENSDAKVQTTANNIYYNGDSVAGTGAQANSAAKGSLYLNPIYPRPTTGCVNVRTFGAKGDGVTDDTAAIQSAYNSNSQVFFPLGTYKTSGSITLKAGQAMFGSGVTYSPSGGAPNSPRGGTVLYCQSSAPALVVTGSGTGNGVIITDFNIYQNGTGPVCVWNGDPSSQVLDTQLTGGAAAASPLINIQSGGGFFENGWWPNDFNMPVGLSDTAAGPLYLSSIQTEHYGRTANTFSGASQVYALNLEDEFSPAYVSINNSSASSYHRPLQGRYDSAPRQCLCFEL